jgi:hypothetical protein
MTDSGSDVPEENAMTSGADDASVSDATTKSSAGPVGSAGSLGSADLPELSAAQEAEVRSLLGSLDTPTMPTAVHDRLIAALSAEPNPFAIATVIPLATGRRHKNRWLVAASGVAAAGVLGVILAPGLLSGESTGPALPTAAVVPMTASGTVYEKQGLIKQITSALPTWKQAALNSAPDDLVELPAAESADVTASEPSAGPSASVTADTVPGLTPVTVNKRVLGQINDCVRVMDTRTPIHVDIASYRDTPAQAAEPVAVFALEGENDDVEVYVVSVACTPSDPGMVREHVTVTP